MTGRPAPLAAERQKLVVPAVAAAQPQEAVGQDAALEEGFELVLYEPRKLRSGAGQVERGAIGRPLGLPGDGLHARLSKW
jgi:hypothetical protein